MTPKPQFDLDLRYGKGREDALAHLLMSVRIEVKSDRKCARTGNFAIEYEQVCVDGEVHKSGIASTEAEWHALEYDVDRWLLISTDDLKAITRLTIKAKRHKWVGDNDAHHCALVPLKWLTTERPMPHLHASEEKAA